MENAIFYGLAGVLILMSLLTVSVPNLLHAAISLIGSFFATAALYLLLQMEFVALAQIMIYIGGIVVFMVITILLTAQLGAKNLPPSTWLQRLWGGGVCLSLLVVLWLTLQKSDLPPVTPIAPTAEPASLTAVGFRLLSAEATGFIVPFEIISLLLFTALIGAVVVARRDSKPAVANGPPVLPEQISEKESV